MTRRRPENTAPLPPGDPGVAPARERVLVVEAAPAGVSTAAGLLSLDPPDAGRVIVRAATIREATELLPGSAFDVIVLDPFRMEFPPDKALSMVQTAAPSHPLVLFVPATSEQFAREAVLGGVQDYVAGENATPGQLNKAVWHARWWKQMEERLYVFTRAVEQSPASILITDPLGVIQYVNPRFTEVSGYAPEEVWGKTPRVLKSGLMPPEVYEQMWRTLTSGGEWRGELQNRKKSGDLFWEYVSISAIRDYRGVVTHYLSVKEDLTEQKQLEQQASRAERMEGVAHALGGIANSFNDILNNVLGFASLIRKHAGDPEKTIRYLSTVEKSVHRGSELAQRLLSFATVRMEKNETLNLRTLLEESVRRVKDRIPHGLSLRMVFAPNLPQLSGDRGALVLCFTHLLENACEAMREGRGDDHALTIEARPLARQGGDSAQAVAVNITDTGEGIPRDLHDTVFEPFFSTKGEHDRLGLGLSAVHTIVRRHRGTISVRSEAVRGTTFTVVLPALAPPVPSAETVEEIRLRGERELILLVDDEPSMLSFAREVLEEHNYRVLTARDGHEALDVFRRHASEISLVILDLLMPGMDGGTTYLEIKKMAPGVRAFFCTGFTSDTVITSLLAEENLRALRKPFRVDDFLTTIREVLRAA